MRKGDARYPLAMRIRVLSDLHLEFQRWNPPPAPADVVVMAGDIHSGTEGIRWARRSFPDSEIVYVAGNHEFYGTAMQSTLAALRLESRKYGVHLLDADMTDIAGVRFLGATLWTDFELNGSDERDIARSMSLAQTMMSDYQVIRSNDETPLSPRVTRDIHRVQRAWLANELNKPFSGGTVVVTHHLPHPSSVHEKYRGDALNPCFASDLSVLVGPPATLWLHGHTHESMDYEVGGTRVVCNPRGYLPHEPNPNFNPELVVEI